MELIIEALQDSAGDTIKLIPFLFVTYVFMEWLERKTEDKTANLMEKVNTLGPLFGGLVGVIPQCGFSAAASSMYAGGVITLGTLLAVFLSTSDEMLPIFISTGVALSTMWHILLTKAFIGVITGFFIDGIVRLTRKKSKTKHIHDLCEAEHCGCDEKEEGNIFHAALVHTLHIVFFIFIIGFVLTFLVEGLGKDAIAQLLTNKPVLGVLIAGIIGLIPNCAASVTITQLYLSGLLGAGQMMAGLLVGAGVGLLVLFRTNDHVKENLHIMTILYICGVAWGILIESLGIVF